MIQKDKTSGEMSIVVSKKEPSDASQTDGQIKILIKGGKAPYKLTVYTSTRTKDIVYTSETKEFNLKDLSKGFYLLNVNDSGNNFTSESIHL
jgi:hypothetical protein